MLRILSLSLLLNSIRGVASQVVKMETNYIKIIKRELVYWQDAYPEQKEILEKFANKIKYELEFAGYK